MFMVPVYAEGAGNAMARAKAATQKTVDQQNATTRPKGNALASAQKQTGKSV